jgi:hypothetical protein
MKNRGLVSLLRLSGIGLLLLACDHWREEQAPRPPPEVSQEVSEDVVPAEPKPSGNLSSSEHLCVAGVIEAFAWGEPGTELEEGIALGFLLSQECQVDHELAANHVREWKLRKESSL